MRLRAEVSQASRVGLAGRMLGDAQQAFCTRARGLAVFGAGVAGMREGRSLYTWLPVQLQGCCSAQTLLFRLLRQ